MYNGIGLPTPRGSGTNGYVQRNLSFVRKIKDKINYHTEDELKKLDSTINKAPNKDILLHQRKREMELKCVEMEELMKEQGYSQEEIEEKVATFRFMLMNAEDIGDRDIPKDEHGRPTDRRSPRDNQLADPVDGKVIFERLWKGTFRAMIASRMSSCNRKTTLRSVISVKESHQIAEANQEKNQRVKEAFGISPFFVEGSSLDPDRKQKEAAAAAAALAEKNKQYSLIKDSSSSPSPVREKEKSRKKKKSRDESESPVRSKKKKSSKKHRRERSQSHEQKKKKKKKRKSGKDKYKHRSLSSEGKKKTRETSVSSSHSTNTSESEDSTPVTSDSGSDHSSNDSFIENRRFDKTLKKKSHLHKHVRSSKKQKEQRESSIESHSRRSRRDQCESSKRNKRKQKDSVSTSSNSSVDVSKGENSFCNRKKKQTELGNMVARSKTISECHSKSINTKHKKRKHNEISSDDEHVNFKLAKRKLVVHSPSSSSSSSETSRMREKSTKVKYHKKSASTDRNKKHVKGMSAERESRSLSYSPVAHSQSKEFNDEPCYTTEKFLKKKSSDKHKYLKKKFFEQQKLLKKKSSDMQKFESQSSKGNKCGKEKNKKSNKIALIKERDVEDSESDPALHYAIKQIRVSKKKKHRTSSSKYNGYHPSTSSSSTYSDSHSSRSPSVRKRHSTSSDSDALSHKTKKPRNPSEEINQSSVEIYNKHNSTSRKFTDFSSEFQNKNSASLNRKQSNDALPQPWPALVPCNEKKRGQISIKINQLSDIAKKCSPLKQDKGHSPTVTSKNDTVLENTSKNANLVIVEKNQAQSAEIPNTCLTDLPPLSTNLLRSSGEKQGSPVKSNRSLSPSKRNSHSSSSSRSRSRSHTPTRNRSRSISHSPSHNRSRSRSRSPTHSRSNSRHSSRSHSRSYSSHSRSRSRSASRSPSIPRRRGSPSFLDKRRITRSHGRSRYRHYSRSHSRSPYRSYRRRYSSSRSYSRSRSRSRSHDYNKSRHHY